MKHDNSYQNPWAGLSSYEDPGKSELKLKFCGRENETKEVTRLIDDNFFVTLYGKSGIGKTSLLNAGVFPALRREQYTPLSLRLGMTDEAQTYQDIITTAIERTIKECGGSVRFIKVVDEQTDRSAIDYLWNWFARHCFLSADNQTTFPVIVFDQFEEVFRHPESRQKTEVLLTQLHYLIDESHALNDCIVNGEQYYYDFNFRFVLSIREDDLYRLEDNIDNCALTALKRCRYRLRSLSERSAEAVVLVPGRGLFLVEEQKSIVDTIIGIARNKEDKGINTNVLSLICSRIYVDFKKSGADHITPSLVDSFIKGNPFERFYNEATRGFSNKEKSYIEDNLVDSTGRRNSIPESNFLKHVPKGMQLLEGDARILQRNSTSSDGSNYRIELIHDSFCEPLSKQKEKRDKKKRLLQLAGISGVAVISIGIIAFVIYQMNLATKANRKMMENQARAVANVANQLADEGDSYIARLLSLEVLPSNLDNPDRVYTPEAEAALRKANLRDDAILRGHTWYVYSASFSPDGKTIVSASDDKTIRIWDARTGQELHALMGHSDAVRFATFSPDGTKIVSASEDNTVRIWNARTGKETHILVGHTNRVNFAAFSPDGKRIVSASADETLRIWDTQTGEELQILNGHTGWFNSAVYSPDGTKIVSASYNNSVCVWNVQTGQEVQILTGHTNRVNFATFSPDGKKIISASDDETIRIWDAKTGQELKTLDGHSSSVESVAFSHDGKLIVSASRDHTIRVWDVQAGQELQTLKGHIGLGIVNFATFSPDDMKIVSASWDKTIRIWDIQKKHGAHIVHTTSNVNSVAVSPNGRLIVSAFDDNTVRIWNVQTGQDTHVLNGHTERVISAAFSPDGKKIVSTSSDNTVRVWDSQTGHELQVLRGHIGWVYSAIFSTDGTKIVSSSSDNTVRVWDSQTGHELLVLKGQENGFYYSAAFSPDDRRIVSASGDKSIRIWDVQTGRELLTLNGHAGEVYSVGFNPDGTKIVSASWDNTIRIWDAQTGRELLTLNGHDNWFNSAVFSPDGTKIVSASSDNTVRVWDSQTGQEILTLDGHKNWVNSAVFNPDGTRIISASNDNTIRIWEFPPLQEIIDETRERFKNRPLTPEERRKYYLE